MKPTLQELTQLARKRPMYKHRSAPLKRANNGSLVRADGFSRSAARAARRMLSTLKRCSTHCHTNAA